MCFREPANSGIATGWRDILLGDTCFYSYFMIALLRELGVDVVVQQHRCRTTDFTQGKRSNRVEPRAVKRYRENRSY